MLNTGYDASSLNRYLKSIKKHVPMSREQEYELVRRARNGDVSARDELAKNNLPFVVSVARRYARRGARIEDLVQEGNVGLMKAIEHFDVKKNVRFATYSVWWVRAYITRYLKENRSQVRRSEQEKLKFGDISLDAPIDDEGEMSLLDMLEDGAETPDTTFHRSEQSEQVAQALVKVKKRLGDLGWDIVETRLTQDSPRTLEELGMKWGVSRERVRQIELRTKQFLARYLAAFDPRATELEPMPALY